MAVDYRINDFLFITNNNNSHAEENQTLNLLEIYKTAEKDSFEKYTVSAAIIGSLVVLCNLIVVVSSGLILKKGQQPKSTYILLGNVSLADTIVGLFLIYSALGRRTSVFSGLCVFKTGMLVCPAIVSIFSVALIAVDRYCYILHGLYYHRYFTTTKVRISICIVWFLGITLGFLPATGWVKQNAEIDSLCSYIELFPDYLILFNSFLSITALLLIAVLYSIILINALRNVKNIRASKIVIQNNKRDSKEGPNLRTVGIHRVYTNNPSIKVPHNENNNVCKVLKKSASFSSNRDFKYFVWANLNTKSKSNDDITCTQYNKTTSISKKTSPRFSTTESDYSIDSIDLSSSTEQTESSTDISKKCRLQKVCNSIKANITNKKKEPSKFRAIMVVTLTSGSIIITWLPFFITVILFISCANKQSNVQCLQYKLLLGPFITLAFLNSLLNPLIYAWWHKGFKKSIKHYYRRYVYNKISLSLSK